MKNLFANLSLLKKAHVALFSLFAIAAVLLGINTYSENRTLIDMMREEIIVVHFLSVQIIEEFYKKSHDGSYTSEEAQEAALTALGSIDLLDRGYVTVMENNGTILLHPTKEGSVVQSIIIEGSKVPINEATEIVKQSGGMMTYRGSIGDKKLGKISFFEPWGWLILYGRYQDDVNQILLKGIMYDIVVAMILLAILGLILLHIRKAVIAPLGQCIYHINRIIGGEASPNSQNEIQTLSEFTDSIVSLTVALKETIRKTKKVEKTLKDNQQLLFEVLNNSRVAISIKDKHLNYLRVNKAFEKFISTQGKPSFEHSVHKDLQEKQTAHPFLAEVKKFETYVQQHNESVAKEIVFNMDGQELSWLVTSFPIYDSNNDFYAVCTMGTDITALKKNEKEIRKINTKLRKRTEELQNFIHVISHDLKSPLKNIGNCCQLLGAEYGDMLDSNASIYINHAIKNANKMVKLISELLTYSRVAKLTGLKKEFDCNIAVENAVTAVVTLEDKPKIKVTYKDLPRIYANEVTITQVFQNLIDNSIKHSLHANESVEVKIEARQVDKNWEFSITDNGPGINAKYAKLIFKIFQKLEIQKSDYESSGTGLAICKNIIEQHGGDIWLDTTYKDSARFKFTLPISK